MKNLTLTKPITGVYLNLNNIPYKFNLTALSALVSNINFYYVDYYPTKFRALRADYLYLGVPVHEITNKTLSVDLLASELMPRILKIISLCAFDRIVIKIQNYNNNFVQPISELIAFLARKNIADIVFDLYENQYIPGYIQTVYSSLLYDHVNQINLYLEDYDTVELGQIYEEMESWTFNNKQWIMENNLSVRQKKYHNPYLKYINGPNNYLGLGDNAVSYVDSLFFQSYHSPKTNQFEIKVLYADSITDYAAAIKNKISLFLLETDNNLEKVAEELLLLFLGADNYQMSSLPSQKNKHLTKFDRIAAIMAKIEAELKINTSWFVQIYNPAKINDIINLITSFY